MYNYIKFFCCLLLTISFNNNVISQNVITINGVHYIIENGEATVGRQDKELSGDIIIPSTIEYEGQSYTVKSIISPIDTHSYGGMSSISADEAAFQGSQITSISIPSTITNISSCAFINCSNLQKVVLPETLISIEWGAFAYCNSLTDINLPQSLQSLSTWSFGGCSSLKNISIPDNITSLPASVFKDCGFESFDIPATINWMGEQCLNMTSLKTVKSYIRDITKIYYHDDCFGTVTDKNLLIPNGSKFIYQEYNPWRKFATIEEFDDGHTGEPITPSEFIATVDNIRYKINEDGSAVIVQQNETLTGDIIIPESITVGGKTYTVSEITGPKDTKSWGGLSSISAEGAAFQGTTITSIVIPSTIKIISSCAFINCTTLQKVVLPETITSIEWGAFAYCSSLKEIRLPESLTQLSSWCLAGCTELNNINIPKQITYLPSACFKNSGLKYIELPEKLSSLNSLCLNTSTLEKIKIFNVNYNEISTSENAFGTYDNIQNTDLLVPKGSKSFYSQTYPWQHFRSIEEFGFNINLNYNEGGELLASRNIAYDENDEIIINIVPKDGYKLVSLTVNNVDVTDKVINFEYRLCDVKEDVVVSASFAYKTHKLTYILDGIEYKTYDIEYGAVIIPEADPIKEGYTFSGWSEIPETMPAKDVTVYGTFTINKYKLIYKVDGDDYKTYDIEYGASITPEEAPIKEGYTFSGWSDIPETMPAKDVTVTGAFTVNKYKLTYIIDGEEYKSYEIEYGSSISPEASPTKDGYTFSGWSDIPETMPAKDVAVTGSFTINKYKLTYIVDGEEYKSYEIEYGATITPEAEPTKEGYTFSGWGSVPTTMPANDVTVYGTFSKGAYKLIYMVDGEEYKTYTYDFGATITPEAAPTKEGYTFSGWSEIPETMPAHDVEINGSFTVNKYKLTYIIDGQTYKEYEIEYGSSITPEPDPTWEGYTFSGWSEIPETMPAHDVEITGSFTQNVKADPDLAINGKGTFIAELGFIVTLGQPHEIPELFNPYGLSPIEWTSSNPNVATVDANGVLTLLSVGETQIIATFAGNNEYEAGMAEYSLVVIDSGYMMDNNGNVTVIGGDQTGDVTIDASITINGHTYQVTSIAAYAFKDNQNITSLTIPAGITTIGDNAFNGCINLIVINIGKDVQSIGNKAFANIGTAAVRTRSEDASLIVNCYAESVPQAAWDAFENSPIENGILYVEDDLKDSYKATSPWNKFGKILGFNEPVGINSISIDSDNAIIFDMQGNRLDNVRKGVNIIHTRNGKTKKMIRK